MAITDIYEAMNSKVESFFEWAQAHPKYGLLFVAGLLALCWWGCCCVGNGRVAGSLAASCGCSTAASLKRTDGFRWYWSAWL